MDKWYFAKKKQKFATNSKTLSFDFRSLVIDAPLNPMTTQTLEVKYYGRFVTFLFHFLDLTLWSSYPRLWSSFSWARRLCLLLVSLSLGASGCSEPSRWRGKRNICYFQQKKDVIAKVISKPLLTVIRRNVNPCLQNICSSGTRRRHE